MQERDQMYAKDHPNSHLELKSSIPRAIRRKHDDFEQKFFYKSPSSYIVLSGVSDALAPIAEKKGILLIGVNTATNTFVDNYREPNG